MSDLATWANRSWSLFISPHFQYFYNKTITRFHTFNQKWLILGSPDNRETPKYYHAVKSTTIQTSFMLSIWPHHHEILAKIKFNCSLQRVRGPGIVGCSYTVSAQTKTTQTLPPCRQLLRWLRDCVVHKWLHRKRVCVWLHRVCVVVYSRGLSIERWHPFFTNIFTKLRKIR